MGLDAVVTVIPAPEYRKYRANPKHYVTRDAGKFDLYREWLALDAALNKMKSPLNLALRGNRPEGEDDGYYAMATAGLVKEINKALANVSEAKLLAALKEAGWRLRKYEQKYYVAALKTLKAAYRSAAKKNACLSILIC